MDLAGASATPETDVVFRDGLGERRLIQDLAGTKRELLSIRRALADVPAFEFALRDRTRRLSSFRHPYFVQVRSVERFSDRALTLVSDRFNGIRLAQLFPRVAQRGVRLDIDTTVFWLRQLLEAVARLHESYREIAHGALGPDRIMLTSNGRLMVTEYVLGGALDQLEYSPEQYWRELRIPVLHRPDGRRHLDQRTDVAQIGVLALSLILGRTLRGDEYPRRVGDLLASAWAMMPTGNFEPVPPELRQWLARTLQLDVGRSFASADEASRELEHVCTTIAFTGSARHVEAFLERYRSGDVGTLTAAGQAVATEPSPLSFREPTEADSRRPYADEGPAAPLLGLVPPGAPGSEARGSAAIRDAWGQAPSVVSAQPVVDLGLESFESEAATEATIDIGAFESERALPDPTTTRPIPSAPIQVAAASAVAPQDESPPITATGFTVLPPGPEFEEDTALPPTELPVATSTPEGLPNRRRAPVVAALAAAVLVVVVATPWLTRAPATVSTGTLSVTTMPRGAAASVDGRPVGATPVTVTVSPGYHTLEVRHDGVSRTVPIVVQAGGRFEQHLELPPEPKDDVASGWVTVRALLDLDVYEGDSLVGNTSAGRLALPAGTHVLTFRNDRLGFRTTRSVGVTGGQSTTTVVDVPNGLVRVIARPWADVWIDGRAVGRTPVGNLPLPIGPHDVVLRHPLFGEQRHEMVVSVSELALLDVDFRPR